MRADIGKDSIVKIPDCLTVCLNNKRCCQNIESRGLKKSACSILGLYLGITGPGNSVDNG